MKRLQLSVLTCGVVLALAMPAAGHGPGWSVGVRIGGPPVVVAPRPWYGYGYYSYVRPVWYEPAPVIVAPRTVVVEPAPTFVAPAPSVVPVPSTVVTAAKADSVSANLELLRHPDEKTRGDAVMELGRAKSERAVDPLTATLAGDKSPLVRDAAARALALIGSPRALTALIYAASADPDRDVRRSAQFAVEVIQSKR